MIEKDALVRLVVFTGVLVLMGTLECVAPKKTQVLSRSKRWMSHFFLVVIDIFAVRVVFPLSLVGFARFIETQGHQAMLQYLRLSGGVKILVAILLLDFVIYLQHLMFHKVPWLWRLHLVHHADLDLDVTSGFRFHPLEIIVSMGIKVAAIYLIGAPATSVLAFEIILNATSMFNHSNVRFPLCFDKILRWILVTPDMHRVHHSVIERETNSNFAFNFPIWDRLFKTYRAQPEKGHQKMVIGLSQFQTPEVTHVLWMLLVPFRSH